MTCPTDQSPSEYTDSDLNTIFILSSARSGSTWLAKVFDAHPMVLYRHEPDRVVSDAGLPFFPLGEELDQLRGPGYEWVERMKAETSMRVAGSLPQFRKSYRTLGAHWLRLAWLLAGKTIERFGRSRSVSGAAPDLIDQPRAPVFVIKSVDSVGRAGLIAELSDRHRVVHLIRHPCGYVASQLRGAELGLLTPNPYLESIVGLPSAVERGLTLARLRSYDPIQQLALAWALKNEHGLKQSQKLPNVRVVLYDSLIEQASVKLPELLEWCGLEWSWQCARFLDASNRPSKQKERYYGVERDAKEVVNKWRETLTPDQQRKIVDAVSDTMPWRIVCDAGAV